MNTEPNAVLGMIFILIIVLVYFLPGIVGFSKGKNNAGAIFILNLFLGWSFIGWIVALIWATANDPKIIG